MKKNIISMLLSISFLLSATVVNAFDTGDMSDAYNYVDKVSAYASEMFIDDSLTNDDIIKMGLSKVLEKKPELVDEILKEGFSQLDNYTEFYTYDEYKSFVNEINHTFYGIGVVIQKNGEYVEVVRCLNDGGAAEVGLKTGDKIIRVNGDEVINKSLDYVQDKIIGELGTSVSVTILREDGEFTYSIIRRPVSNETVSYVILENNVAYVEILNFASETALEFANVLDELKGLGVKNIILDLRNNPGGYLQTAITIGEIIVPKGIIVQTMYRQEENNMTFYSDLEKPEFEFAVLVNENTASAAEILSAAIQESGVGKLVGTQTFGKALIQEIIRLPDGCAFKITTGKYLTRNGKDINKIGITPDIELANPKQKITTSRYTQFDFSVKEKVGDSSESVIAAKERLYLLGYKITRINEDFDEELQNAVFDFQADVGLFPYGVLDITTKKQLDTKFSELDEDYDMQLVKAYELFGGNAEMLFKTE